METGFIGGLQILKDIFVPMIKMGGFTIFTVLTILIVFCIYTFIKSYILFIKYKSLEKRKGR